VDFTVRFHASSRNAIGDLWRPRLFPPETRKRTAGCQSRGTSLLGVYRDPRAWAGEPRDKKFSTSKFHPGTSNRERCAWRGFTVQREPGRLPTGRAYFHPRIRAPPPPPSAFFSLRDTRTKPNADWLGFNRPASITPRVIESDLVASPTRSSRRVTFSAKGRTRCTRAHRLCARRGSFEPS